MASCGVSIQRGTATYNCPMVWSKWIWIVSPIVAVLGWAGTTIVRAWLEGTPLNGLRKLLGRSAAPTKKTALSIIVLTAPEPKWHIGARWKTANAQPYDSTRTWPTTQMCR